MDVALRSGHEVTIFNRTEAKMEPLIELGAIKSNNVSEAIQKSEATIFVVLDGTAVKEILSDEDTQKSLNGKQIMIASMTTLDEIMEINEIVIKNSGKLAEMNIQAEEISMKNGQAYLDMVCSVEDEHFWKNLLSTFSGNVRRLGAVGDASKIETAKTVYYMLNVVTLAYTTAFSQKLGLPKEVYESELTNQIPMSEYLKDKMSDHNYNEIFFSIENYVSGLKNSVETAESIGVNPSVLQESLRLFQKTVDNGYANQDGASVLETLI